MTFKPNTVTFKHGDTVEITGPFATRGKVGTIIGRDDNDGYWQVKLGDDLFGANVLRFTSKSLILVKHLVDDPRDYLAIITGEIK